MEKLNNIDFRNQISELVGLYVIERAKLNAKNDENISGSSDKRYISNLFWYILIITLNIIYIFNMTLLQYSIYSTYI